MLEQTIPDNLNKYQDAETWVDQYFIDNDKPNYFFDTGIEVDDYQLISGGPETDFSNAKILYEALQGHINLVQASDLRLWAYMAHKQHWDYMHTRWGIDLPVSDIWHQDLIFRKGEMCLIEAASGTGKSSLCSYIYGYRNDYQGIINFDETNIKAYSVKQWVDLRKHSLSMLFQDLRIFTELTALENVQLKNNLTGYKKKKEILAFFEKLGLSDKLNVKTGKLSFGQQQRVAFIRALCQPFDFLFLDEPISHLDDDNSRIMGELIIGEAEKQQAGVIATSIGKHIELPYQRILQL